MVTTEPRCRSSSGVDLSGYGGRTNGPGVLDDPHAMGNGAGCPGTQTFDDFLIMNGPYRHSLVKVPARAVWAKFRPPAS
jgi:hypothetical protein